MKITRRQVLAATGVGAAATALGAAPGCNLMQMRGVKVYENAAFYSADGKFDADAAKKAYFDMMQRFGYPIPRSLREGLWALDFNLGRFTSVGMGGIFWINDKEGKYLGHEIFLLPGQMIPEHWHVKTPEVPAKMEAWHLRYGSVTLFGEGEPTQGAEMLIPVAERPFTTVRHAKPLTPGDVSPLNRAEARHFMVAGPQGCIVTEYASYHEAAALRFTNPNVKL